MTNTACLPECLCKCGNSKAAHVRMMHVPNYFVPWESGDGPSDAHAPLCPNGPRAPQAEAVCTCNPNCFGCECNCHYSIRPAPQAEDGGKVGRKVCQKIPHSAGGGYMHDEEHDGPYDVDGVLYCGRCHSWYNNPADHGAPALSEQPRTAAGNVDLWDKHQAVRLNLQKEVWASQAVARDLEAERDALRAEVGTWKEQYEAETRSLQNLVAFALEPITPNYEKPMQGEHNVVRDTLARLFGFEILATQQIDALRAELAAARDEIAKLKTCRHEWGDPQTKDGMVKTCQLCGVGGTDCAAATARADKAEAEVVRLTEKERMVDAAVSVLSISNTEKTLTENLLPRENAYWTAAQDDVARAIRREMRERDRADKAEQEYREIKAVLEVTRDDRAKAEERVRELEEGLKELTDVIRRDKVMEGPEYRSLGIATIRLLYAREQKEGGR